MKLRAILIIVAVLSLAYGNPAFGYVVTVEVEGVVTSIGGYGGVEQDGSVIVSETVMTGSFSYDSETPDQAGNDNGFYWLNSLLISVGNYTFTDDPEDAEDIGLSILVEGVMVKPGQFRYEICNFPDFEPLFYGPCYLNGQPTTLEDLDLPCRGMEIILEGDNDGTITDALPNEDTFPDLSVFIERKTFSVGNDGGLAFGIGVEITSITVIPEPGTLLLLGLGGLAILRRKQKQFFEEVEKRGIF